MNTGQHISSDARSCFPSTHSPASSTFSQTVHLSPQGAGCTASTASRSPLPHLASSTRDQFRRTSGSTSNMIASSSQVKKWFDDLRYQREWKRHVEHKKRTTKHRAYLVRQISQASSTTLTRPRQDICAVVASRIGKVDFQPREFLHQHVLHLRTQDRDGYIQAPQSSPFRVLR